MGRDRFTDEVVLLWVARETGVLEALLTSADTPEAVARETGIPERGARVLTRALADRGFLEVVEGDYEPTNRALGFLARRDPRSVGSLPHRVDALERILDLPGALAEGRTTREPDHWTTHRLGAVQATPEAAVRATVTAAVRERPGADRVLDVGGAPGTYATEIADRGFEVTLCDHPAALEVARPFLANEPVALREFDPRGETPLPDGDLALVPGLTHRLGPGDNRRLFERLAAALAPAGTAVVVDHLRGRSDRGAAVALDALANTGEGEVYGDGHYRDWADAAGFEVVGFQAVPGTDLTAVVARLAES